MSQSNDVPQKVWLQPAFRKTVSGVDYGPWFSDPSGVADEVLRIDPELAYPEEIVGDLVVAVSLTPGFASSHERLRKAAQAMIDHINKVTTNE